MIQFNDDELLIILHMAKTKAGSAGYNDVEDVLQSIISKIKADDLAKSLIPLTKQCLTGNYNYDTMVLLMENI